METKAPFSAIAAVIAAQPKTKKGVQVKVPVKVKNFKVIQAITLCYTFNPKVLNLIKVDFAKTMPEGYVYNAVPINEETSELRIAWSSATPFSLKTNQILFTATFKYFGGESKLIWQTDKQHGEFCEYAIVDYVNHQVIALYDEPAELYYKDGKVTGK